jgi:hypothetical protein
VYICQPVPYIYAVPNVVLEMWQSRGKAMKEYDWVKFLAESKGFIYLKEICAGRKKSYLCSPF